MKRENWFSGVARTLLIFIVLSVAGCASMNSSREELQSVAAGEGIVVGSVLIKVAKESGQSSGLFQGSKAEELNYSVAIAQSGLNPFKETYELPVSPGKETYFVKKLKAGDYQILNLTPAGLFAMQVSFGIKLNFKVLPGETNYIGHLVIELPARIRPGSPFNFAMENDKEAAQAHLRDNYPSLSEKIVVRIAGVVEGIAPQTGAAAGSLILQSDTMTMLNAMDAAEDGACKKRLLADVEVLKQSANSSEERWTLDRCGKFVAYLVTFRPATQGGTDIEVKKVP